MIFLTGSMCPEDLKKFLISAKNCKDVFEVPNALYDLTFSLKKMGVADVFDVLNSVHEPAFCHSLFIVSDLVAAKMRELDLHAQTWKIPQF